MRAILSAKSGVTNFVTHCISDATNEYIRGGFDSDEDNCDLIENQEIIWSRGLHCVTVLIGAFNMSTGQPIIGVINQPFWKFDSESKK